MQEIELYCQVNQMSRIDNLSQIMVQNFPDINTINPQTYETLDIDRKIREDFSTKNFIERMMNHIHTGRVETPIDIGSKHVDISYLMNLNSSKACFV